jgi:hypothetical protein
MVSDSKSSRAHDGDAPVSSKEIDLTGSASGSEIEPRRDGKGYREGPTFVTHGLNQSSYKPVASYEGAHRYDADFQWEPEEERKVIRKVGTTRMRDHDESLTHYRLTSAFAPGFASCSFVCSSIAATSVRSVIFT